MVANPGSPGYVQVHISLEIPLEALLSPRGDLSVSSEPANQALIDGTSMDQLPSSGEGLVGLVQTALEVRGVVHYHLLDEVAQGRVTWRVERPEKV